MNPQENIPVHIKRRIHLIDKVIDNLLPNMYPCDYNSSDHFVEGVLDEIFYFLGGEPDFYGIDLFLINDFILDHKYDELTDYFHDHCIVLKNDNLQESIRRILREENKKSGLLKAIEEDGLYQFIQDTGLSMGQIILKYDNLPREVFERYIKDFLNEEGYHQTDGAVQLGYEVEISHNLYVNHFYMKGDKVTVETRRYNDYNEQTEGYIESLSNLTDEEIFSIVDDMTSWSDQNDL